MIRNIKKLYYSIGEVSDIVDVKQYVLRYWESEFPTLSPSKNRAGNRAYREKDILIIRFIKHLLYDKKFTIEGAKQKLKEISQNDLKMFHEHGKWNATDIRKDSDSQNRQILLELKKGLQELAEILDR